MYEYVKKYEFNFVCNLFGIFWKFIRNKKWILFGMCIKIASNVILISRSFKNYVLYYYCRSRITWVTTREYKCFVLVMYHMYGEKRREKKDVNIFSNRNKQKELKRCWLQLVAFPLFTAINLACNFSRRLNG